MLRLLPRRVLVVAIAAAALSATMIATSAGAAVSNRCPGSLTAHRDGVTLTATRLHTRGSVGCNAARSVVHDYLDAKLVRPIERCAGPAVNPPYRGCQVDGFVCRLAARSAIAESCAKRRLTVFFVERDADNG